MESSHCQLYLYQADGSLSVDLPEKQLELGCQVDGPGRLEYQGVAGRHAKVWRDKSGNWVKPLNRQPIWLNSVPVSIRARTKLYKGDSLVLGETPHGLEFWLLCRRAKSVEESLKPRLEAEQLGGVGDASAGGVKSLSRAEYDVLALMARGLVEVEDVARRLFRSVNTVRTQLSKIYEKIGVHSRAELLGALIRNGIACDRQKRDVLSKYGDCPCSGRFATGAEGAFAQLSSEQVVSQ